MNGPHSVPDQSCFSIKMPDIPDNTESGIGFIVDKSYNHNSNIKVLQDVVLSVIFNLKVPSGKFSGFIIIVSIVIILFSSLLTTWQIKWHFTF